MKIIKKTPEEIQASIEVFGEKHLPESSFEQERILTTSRHSAEGGKRQELKKNFYDKYKKFLGNKNDEDGKRVKRLYKNVEEYSKFKPYIDGIKRQLKNKKPVEISDYLGSGGEGHSFLFNFKGKKMVLKFFHNRLGKNFEIKKQDLEYDFKIKNFEDWFQNVSEGYYSIFNYIRNSGFDLKEIESIPKVICFSYPDQVLIKEYLSGETLEAFLENNQDFNKYLDEHLENLMKKIIELKKNDINFDCEADNLLYDREKGFSVLDFFYSKGGVLSELILENLANILTERKRTNFKKNQERKNFKNNTQKKLKEYFEKYRIK